MTTTASTPYYDMTFSAEKSVSLMYAGLLAAAKQAQDQGDEQAAEPFRSEAERVEAAVMAGADRMLQVAEQRGAIVRTGASQLEQRRVPGRRGVRGGQVPPAHQPGR